MAEPTTTEVTTEKPAATESTTEEKPTPEIPTEVEKNASGVAILQKIIEEQNALVLIYRQT